MSQYFDEKECPRCHGLKAIAWCPMCAGYGYAIEEPLGSRRFRPPRSYEHKYSDGSQVCPQCKGGRAVPCPECRGTGYIRNTNYTRTELPTQPQKSPEGSFIIRIPQKLHEEMVAHVMAGYPNMACGALGSKDGRVVKHYPTANAAEHPDDLAIIDAEDLLRIYDDIDEYDGEMIFYLSHTRGNAYPSERDIHWAKRNKLYYIIFSCQYYPNPPYARVFSVDESGTVSEGRIETI